MIKYALIQLFNVTREIIKCVFNKFETIVYSCQNASSFGENRRAVVDSDILIGIYFIYISSVYRYNKQDVDQQNT